MRYAIKALLPVALAAAAAGCSDFLSGVEKDPNNPPTLTRPGPLYIAIQTLQSVNFEGQLARNAAEYVQQVAGNSRQQIGYDLYQIDPNTTDPFWLAVYASSTNIQGGGGLLDIKKMEALARARNDSIYLGIGKVYEAMVIGMAASVWGDIPYREAADSTNLKPKFDPQLQVYQDMLAQLDSAITLLTATPGGTNLGPPLESSEIIYNQFGDDAATLEQIYTEVAHSLKARYHLHLAEGDPSHYALALAEAQLGISTPDHDFLWFHDQGAQGTNVWWQFMFNRGDIGPGAAMIQIMKRRITAGLDNAERLNFYFTEAGPGLDFWGYRPGGIVETTDGVVYDGSGAPTSPGTYSGFNFINPDLDAGDVRIPNITYAETQLIAAEAAYRVSGTVEPLASVAAKPFLDAARANRSYGARGNTPITFAALGSVPATLQNIMEEKYVTLFLNIEAWNDYKRTCYPRLAPAPISPTSTSPGLEIAGRVPYGISDLNANAANIPPGVTPTSRNANDPNACPSLDYTSSVPRGN
jgi:hypothetical protein